MAEAFICDFVRTPIGRYGGGLARMRPDDLAAHVIKSLADRHANLKDAIDEVFFGCANQSGEDNRNVARMALLLAGLPEARAGYDPEPPVRFRARRRGRGGVPCVPARSTWRSPAVSNR